MCHMNESTVVYSSLCISQFKYLKLSGFAKSYTSMPTAHMQFLILIQNYMSSSAKVPNDA